MKHFIGFCLILLAWIDCLGSSSQKCYELSASGADWNAGVNQIICIKKTGSRGTTYEVSFANPAPRKRMLAAILFYEKKSQAKTDLCRDCNNDLYELDQVNGAWAKALTPLKFSGTRNSSKSVESGTVLIGNVQHFYRSVTD